MWCESNFEIHCSYFLSKPHYQLLGAASWRLRRWRGGGDNIEHSVPGREDFSGQSPAVLFQFRKLPAESDVGLGEHSPQRFNRLFYQASVGAAGYRYQNFSQVGGSTLSDFNRDRNEFGESLRAGSLRLWPQRSEGQRRG